MGSTFKCFASSLSPTMILICWEGNMFPVLNTGPVGYCEPDSNGMIHLSLGGEEIFFLCSTLLLPALDLVPCLQAQGMRDCNKYSS